GVLARHVAAPLDDALLAARAPHLLAAPVTRQLFLAGHELAGAIVAAARAFIEAPLARQAVAARHASARHEHRLGLPFPALHLHLVLRDDLLIGAILDDFFAGYGLGAVGRARHFADVLGVLGLARGPLHQLLLFDHLVVIDAVALLTHVLLL